MKLRSTSSECSGHSLNASFAYQQNNLLRMLEDLEQGVDRADTKLSGAMKRMKKFVRDTEGESVSMLYYGRTIGGQRMLPQNSLFTLRVSLPDISCCCQFSA